VVVGRVVVCGVVRVLGGIVALMRGGVGSSGWLFRLRAVFCRVRLSLTVAFGGGARGASDRRKG
jgi:hypothetical protein